MPDHQDELPNDANMETPNTPGAPDTPESSESPASAQVDSTRRFSDAADTPTPTRRSNGPKPGKLPPWKVVLHNDDVNGMEDVVTTIKKLTPLSDQAAVRRMLEAHQRGRAMLLTTHRERAELYKYQFMSRGLTVTIGPA